MSKRSRRPEPEALAVILTAGQDTDPQVRQLAVKLLTDAVQNTNRLETLDEDSREKIRNLIESVQHKDEEESVPAIEPQDEDPLERLKHYKETEDLEGLLDFFEI